MRRTVPVLAATAGGLALLANFHTSPASTGALETAGTASTSAAPTTVPGAATTESVQATAVPRPTTTIVATTTTAAPRSTNGVAVDGPVVENRWGPVQVRVTLTGTHIDDVTALVLPGHNSHSAALSREAGPRLRQEALQAQSAQIDVVSGATLTSDGYMQSLQGALDHAGR